MPGSGKSFTQGANCQLFAYEFLRYHGLEIPDFRSSELWGDQEYTCITVTLKPLDLIFGASCPTIKSVINHLKELETRRMMLV